MATTDKATAAKQLKTAADGAKAAAAKPAGHFALNPKLTPELGRLVSILIASAVHRRMSLADAAMMLLPPLAAGQYLVVEAKSKDQAQGGAIAMMSWAKVSEAVDKRLRADPKTARPAPNEWTGGDKIWVVDTVGPPNVLRALLKQAMTSQFKGQSVSFWRRGADGKATVETLKG